MKSVRERFEEIWPVPNVIFWCQDIGRYAPMPDEVLQYERMNEQWAHEHNARLDTFTRCQETTAPVNEIIFHATNLLNYVRDKYGVVGDHFSCEHMRGIAAAIKEIKK